MITHVFNLKHAPFAWVLAILVMEVVTLLNVQVTMGTPQMRSQVEAGLCGGVLLFTVIKFFVDNAFRKWPAWSMAEKSGTKCPAGGPVLITWPPSPAAVIR